MFTVAYLRERERERKREREKNGYRQLRLEDFGRFLRSYNPLKSQNSKA